MSQIGKIKIRNIEELLAKVEPVTDTVILLSDLSDDDFAGTPRIVKESVRQRVGAATTSKKENGGYRAESCTKRGTGVKKAKSGATLTDQKRIDNFFKSCCKTYQVQVKPFAVGKENEMQSSRGRRKTRSAATTSKKSTPTKPRRGRGRKRLFEDNTDAETTTNASSIPSDFVAKSNGKRRPRTEGVTTRARKAEVEKPEVKQPEAVIDLCLDSDDEPKAEKERTDAVETVVSLSDETSRATTNSDFFDIQPEKDSPDSPDEEGAEPAPAAKASACQIETPSESSKTTVQTETGRQRKKKPLPPYKVIAGTTLAVDAFQFGQIEGVTHYFLTHFHSDHYVGLTRKFAMPLYVSPITARLVRAFIPLDEKYIHEIELEVPVVVNDVEVTAIEANHCPGAVMFLFKLATGKCVLHTGDFRACPEMESDPIFWNNDIDTIYLDTTYISDKYAFCVQWESIDNAKDVIYTFRERHKEARILYVCGTYVIGKEKFWSALAHEYELKVWADGQRRKALEAMQVEEYLEVLCSEASEADMHIVPIGQLNYSALMEYFEPYSNHYDLLLAFRPSGWEKNSRPQFRGKINILGVEYSEHSSHDELRRFVMYLKPKEVISTVPVARDLMITAKIPPKWYRYEKLTGLQRSFQPTITNYLKLKSAKAANSKGPTKTHTLDRDLKQESTLKVSTETNSDTPSKSDESSSMYGHDASASAVNGSPTSPKQQEVVDWMS